MFGGKQTQCDISLVTSSGCLFMTVGRDCRSVGIAGIAGPRRMVGAEGVLLTTEQALNNADSFSWFVQALMQDHERSLSAGLKL